jgi:hypothetical protein
MLKTLINIWTEELVVEGRIELGNFVVLETQTIDRGNSVEYLPPVNPHGSSGA